MSEIIMKNICDNVKDNEKKQHKSTVPFSECKPGILPRKPFCRSLVEMPNYFVLPKTYTNGELFKSLEDRIYVMRLRKNVRGEKMYIVT